MPFSKSKVQNYNELCISCGSIRTIRQDHKSGNKLACTAEEVEFLRKNNTDKQIPSLCYIHRQCRKTLQLNILYPNRCSICGAHQYLDFGPAEEIKIHSHPNCLESAKDRVHSNRWKLNVLHENWRKKLVHLDTVDADYREGRKKLAN